MPIERWTTPWSTRSRNCVLASSRYQEHNHNQTRIYRVASSKMQRFSAGQKIFSNPTIWRTPKPPLSSEQFPNVDVGSERTTERQIETVFEPYIDAIICSIHHNGWEDTNETNQAEAHRWILRNGLRTVHQTDCWRMQHEKEEILQDGDRHRWNDRVWQQ